MSDAGQDSRFAGLTRENSFIFPSCYKGKESWQNGKTTFCHDSWQEIFIGAKNQLSVLILGM